MDHHHYIIWMGHVQQRSGAFSDDIRIKPPCIHQRCPMPISIDLRLQSSRFALELIDIQKNLGTILDAELPTDSRKCQIALEAQKSSGERQRAPYGRSFETGGHGSPMNAS